MTWMIGMREPVQWHVWNAALVLLLLGTSGCGALDVSDPTAIEDAELNNAAGAALLRGDALGQFYVAFGALALQSGLLTDEFRMITRTSGGGNQFVDRRDLTLENSFSATSLYPQWPQLRRAATAAYEKLQSYGPRAHAGEMVGLRGYAILRLAEDFCPGFPSTELVDFKVIAGPPLTTEQAFARALADFDTALTLATDSARVLNFVRVGRAATLLNLGQYAAAAAAAAEVPTEYTWRAQYDDGSVTRWNPLLLTPRGSTFPYVTIADQEGGNGLDFVSADDPRVQPRQMVHEYVPGGTTDTGIPVYHPAKYADIGNGAPVVVVSGIEARLIEAEAALATGGPWLTILNDLRATQVSPALPALDDPGTPEARLDLLFRERAFWLYATGHRLGDLRRLIRLYNRDPESVFPAGPYHQHGYVYGTTISLPFNPADEALFNPAITGCTGP